MSVTCLVLIFSFGYCLGLPTTGEILETIYYEPKFPAVLEDPLELDNVLIQWNQEGQIFLINKNNTSSYSDALRRCEKYDMKLVKIENEDKGTIIANLLDIYADDGEGPFWMSGSRLTDGTTWRWLNDEPITYFNWAGVEPNNAKGDEMCIELYRDNAAWNDERCSIPRSFVCENILKDGFNIGFKPLANSNDIDDTETEEVDNESLDNSLPVLDSDSSSSEPELESGSGFRDHFDLDTMYREKERVNSDEISDDSPSLPELEVRLELVPVVEIKEYVKGSDKDNYNSYRTKNHIDNMYGKKLYS